MDRTRVLMTESHDSLQQGEHVNLPHEIAKALVDAGKAKFVEVAQPKETKPVTQPQETKPAGPQETKPAGPQETKVVTPKESKKKGSTK